MRKLTSILMVFMLFLSMVGCNIFLKKQEKVSSRMIVPDMCTYVQKGKTYKQGIAVPGIICMGDKFKDKYYEYGYNQEYDYENKKWENVPDQDGWGIRVLDNTLTEYGEIIMQINSKNVSNLKNTFAHCPNLEIAPSIPGAVKTMENVFKNCKKLKTYRNSEENEGEFSEYGIPTSVSDLDNAFKNCENIVSAPKISSGVSTMNSAFESCNNLTKAPVFTEAITLESVKFTFKDCKNLKNIPDFSNCLKIKYFDGTFENCKKLEGKIEINSKETISDNFSMIDNVGGCFYKAGKKQGCITVSGTCPNVDILARHNAGLSTEGENLPNLIIKEN